MTDKQIIDGVDVRGCEFAPKEIGWCNNGNLSSYCKDNPNCYYKNWQRAEQKLAKIEETVKYYEKRGCRYNDDILDLLAYKTKQIIEGKENELSTRTID